MEPATVQQTLQLRDIHLPPPPPWWPPAPGWWLLGGLLLTLLVLGVWWARRAIGERRRRRRVLALLERLEQDLSRAPAPQHLADLSALLKRLALRRHPRREVAALSGRDWLRFLDRTGGAGAFADGPGRILAEGGYRPDLAEDLDLPGLMRTVRRWVERNLGRPR